MTPNELKDAALTAALRGKIETYQNIINQYPSLKKELLDATNQDGHTALMLVAIKGLNIRPFLQFCLKQGANLSALDNNGENACAIAIKHGNASFINEVLRLSFQLAPNAEQYLSIYDWRKVNSAAKILLPVVVDNINGYLDIADYHAHVEKTLKRYSNNSFKIK